MTTYTSFHQVKGGVGCTTTAATYAVLLARQDQRTLIVDLHGDVAPTLGAATPLGSNVPTHVGDNLDLMLANSTTPTDITETYDQVVYDCGNQFPEPAGRRYLVTRADYVALRNGVNNPATTSLDGFVLVAEDGRALTENDCARALGLRCVATTRHTPVVCRSIDAGLLASRVPAELAVDLQTLYMENA